MLTLLIALTIIVTTLLVAAFIARTRAHVPVEMRDCDVLSRRLSTVDTIAGTDYSPAELHDRATLHRRIVQGGEAITPEALRACRLHLEYAELLDDMACRRQIEDRVHAIHGEGLRQRRTARPAIRATAHIGALA